MKNIIDVEQFRTRPGAEVRLGKRPTNIAPVYSSKGEYKEILRKHTKKLSKLQERLYASNDYALLVIFQAMDAAGKDGVIRHVMSGVNPQGCQVFSFKQPSTNELDHDFLWRTTLCLPERGRIGIFNRSYYEEVVVVRVPPEILTHEPLPKEQLSLRTIWDDRYRSIVDYERHLYENGTRVVKFHLHLSREEQRKRLLARIEDPEKNWKFNVGDIEERKFWRQYQNAYQAAMTATSTNRDPWYVVPADDKRNARLIVSQVIVNTLASLNTNYPKLDAARRRELQKIRKLLEA